MKIRRISLFVILEDGEENQNKYRCHVESLELIAIQWEFFTKILRNSLALILWKA